MFININHVVNEVLRLRSVKGGRHVRKKNPDVIDMSLGANPQKSLMYG